MQEIIQPLIDVAVSDQGLPASCIRTAVNTIPAYTTVLSTALGEDLNSSPHSAKRIAGEATALTTSIAMELGVGNEVAVLGVGTLATDIAANSINSGSRIIDFFAGGILAGSTVGVFSYYQQRAFGGITRWGLKKYPKTTHAASLMANSRRKHMDDSYKSDGIAAITLGTSLAYMRHKMRNPSSTRETENRVIKRGARAIAAFWGGVIGLHGAISTMSKDDSTNVLEMIHGATRVQNLAMIAGAALLGNEWRKLFAKNEEIPHNQLDTPPSR